MKAGSRDEPNTRLYAEQLFRGGDIQMLVTAEAAGEGINLQVCHILFNYDIPWSPNRLEQRMGRIHRYGQLKDCLIFNFIADNTIEGHVLQRLQEKLQEIRNALDDDAVFNKVQHYWLQVDAMTQRMKVWERGRPMETKKSSSPWAPISICASGVAPEARPPQVARVARCYKPHF